ncbi:hypothetical protein HMPREF1544_09474 [Mucor circinelloides 1006PhL]|uniref:FHA domain-containing protein n=1 Tax=Mucor circinelloides f. circinelloides (strain 1006PhL) TaxID=1220926 RepID=S2JVC8_MUCC1|nr:hypothetical protein HMPREF1544_09474 [Mucor circinelloides 1006PhL]
MSEGTSLLDNHHQHQTDRKMTLFQAQMTHFQINPTLAMRCHESSPDAIPVILRGSKSCRTTIGRGHDATIQIGRANKRVSREHVVIEHKPQIDGFELTILSPNGALIDHIVFVEGEHVPVIEGTTIEIVGTKIIFQAPDDNLVAETEGMQDIIETPVEATQETTANAKMEVDEKINIPVMAVEQTTIESTITTSTTTVTQKSSTHHTLNSIIKTTASKLKETARQIIKSPMTREDEIIQVLVHSRKSTMTCADITKRLQGQTASTVLDALKSSTAIGCVKRLGKTADGSPKEDLYYYKPELDPDQERQKRYSDVGKSARKCTMKDTQYFFRIPPKLPHHKTAKTRKRESTGNSSSMKSRQAATEEDDTKSTSSGDVSDMEVYELFKDV